MLPCIGQRAGTCVDRAHHTTDAPGFHLGSAITTNPNANNLAGIFAEMIIEQVHINRQTMPGRADQPAFALYPRAQILKVATFLARGVAGYKGYSATFFIHMHVNMIVGLKLAINHQG